MHQQIEPHVLNHPIAEFVHGLEFPAGVHVEYRERQLAGKEGLAGQVQHHGRILADGIQHDRIVELGGHFTDDVDAFRLKLFEVRLFVEHGYSRLQKGGLGDVRCGIQSTGHTGQSGPWTNFNLIIGNGYVPTALLELEAICL